MALKPVLIERRSSDSKREAATITLQPVMGSESTLVFVSSGSSESAEVY